MQIAILIIFWVDIGFLVGGPVGGIIGAILGLALAGNAK